MDHPPPLHDILFLITRATAIGVETARTPAASALVPPRPCRRQRTSTISSSTTSSRSSFASAESAPAPPRPRRRTVPLGACSITLHSLMGSSEAWLPSLGDGINRLRPKISPVYFGNAIQSVATTATVAELASHDLRWAATRLHATVVAHEDGAIRQAAADWEAAPRCFPLGNPDGAALTMGSSPRFPMYDGNDFGWGRALAVRSGRANKFDGKISAFPGQAGDGSVDVEVCLAPDTMARLLGDDEFLQYVSRAP